MNTNFKFPSGTFVQILNYSAPVQTLTGGSNWSTVEYENGIPLKISVAESVTSGQAAAIKTDGTLWLWGYNIRGQLGIDSTISQSSPVQTITQGTNWKQVNLAEVHSAATKTDGTLWLWGCGTCGRLGNNSTINQSSPVQTITQGTDWKQVALGDTVSAAIKTDGTLWLWGRGLDGQLGNNISFANQSSPVQTVSSGNNWYQVSMGSHHAGAIKTDGTLWLWGCGTFGELGTDSTIARSSPVQTVSSGNDWKQVSLALLNSAAIKTDGTLWLWGDDTEGKLGTNCTIFRSSPVQTISQGTNWKQLDIGDVSSGAIKTDGTLWMWGKGERGFLGNFSTIRQSSPVQTVSSGTDWKNVSVNCNAIATKTNGQLFLFGRNNCGQIGCHPNVPICYDMDDVFVRRDIFSEGGLYLWGSGADGILGNNSTTNQSSPVQTVSGGTNWKQVDLSGLVHSAAIKTDGTLWLWGCNTFGELGNRSTIALSSPVQTVCTGTDWKQVSVGIVHSAAIKTDGTLWLWGYGISGRLGNNSTTNRSAPIQTTTAGTNWKQVSLGYSHSAAIKTDGTLWLWGGGPCFGGFSTQQAGRLGDDSSINRSSPVQTVSTGTNWKQVSLGYSHSAAIKTDGTLWLWGSGGITITFQALNQDGTLGDDSSINQSSPVQTVSTGTNWKQVSLGCFNSAAIKTDGTLWLWGSGSNGVLGNNSTISRSSPVQTVSTGTNWKQVSLGSLHSGGIKTDGTLWLWGDGSNGILGNNLRTNRSSPVQTVSTGTNWKQVSVGEEESAAIREDCW